MNLRRYGYVMALLALLALVAGVFALLRSESISDEKAEYPLLREDSVTISPDGRSKTYVNPQLGFSFVYPADFYLAIPVMFDEEETPIDITTQEELERYEKNRKYREAYQALVQKINAGAIEGKRDIYGEIRIDVLDSANFPTNDELKVECDEERRLNSHFVDEEPCELGRTTRELIDRERELIRTSDVGSTVRNLDRLVDSTVPEGVIVEANGTHGIRSFSLSHDSTDYFASFTTYNGAGQRITLSMPLLYDVEREIAPLDDSLWRQKATDDPRNEAFDDVISSFKFI